MSKNNSRGWRQVLARNPNANPLTDPALVSERSATATVTHRGPLERRDATRYPPEVQFKMLSRSCERILDSLQRAVRLGRKGHVATLTTLLANQRARLEAQADKLAEAMSAEPKRLKTGRKILPDLVTDPYRYSPKAVRPRFERDYVNHGRLIKLRATYGDLIDDKGRLNV